MGGPYESAVLSIFFLSVRQLLTQFSHRKIFLTRQSLSIVSSSLCVGIGGMGFPSRLIFTSFFSLERHRGTAVNWLSERPMWRSSFNCPKEAGRAVSWFRPRCRVWSFFSRPSSLGSSVRRLLHRFKTSRFSRWQIVAGSCSSCNTNRDNVVSVASRQSADTVQSFFNVIG